MVKTMYLQLGILCGLSGLCFFSADGSGTCLQIGHAQGSGVVHSNPIWTGSCTDRSLFSAVYKARSLVLVRPEEVVTYSVILTG